ncbi:putative nuclease HARBI1 [Cucumis melo var. makuwa]|uniref:Nuclease HARBI1 n=1 Tax=Cucumis melo var. makuwa TaxID=1194695 RepID=A0A5D3CXZ3_CUCMM|nr:putative nuclease HARBI1 [Cucumis melo var. makuwa]TYK16783.1 putative nuclease HARBI1 [Cucumis melo var. makuwa]
MDRRTFIILCHLLQTVSGLSSTEIVDVEEMVTMFLHVLAHEVKNRVIQRELVQSVTRYYYLCDVGYPNLEGFLVPYRGQRYHLQEWHGAGNAPTNANEYFNMMHSLTRNVIKCTFGVLKGRWAILREKSYYSLQSQCRTILACCLLHNLINRETTYCDDVDDVDEGDSRYATTTASEDIHYIEMTNE